MSELADLARQVSLEVEGNDAWARNARVDIARARIAEGEAVNGQLWLAAADDWRLPAQSHEVDLAAEYLVVHHGGDLDAITQDPAFVAMSHRHRDLADPRPFGSRDDTPEHAPVPTAQVVMDDGVVVHDDPGGRDDLGVQQDGRARSWAAQASWDADAARAEALRTPERDDDATAAAATSAADRAHAASVSLVRGAVDVRAAIRAAQQAVATCQERLQEVSMLVEEHLVEAPVADAPSYAYADRRDYSTTQDGPGLRVT